MSAMPPQVAAATKRALMAAETGDTDEMRQALQLLKPYGHQAMYAACHAWAHFVELATGLHDERFAEQFVGMRVVVVDGDGGERRIDPEDVSPAHVGTVWAVRFVTGHVNGDHEGCLALYKSADERRLGVGIGELLRLAGAAARAVREHRS